MWQTRRCELVGMFCEVLVVLAGSLTVAWVVLLLEVIEWVPFCVVARPVDTICLLSQLLTKM